MFEEYAGKFIVLQFRTAQGQSHRTIAFCIESKGDFLCLESPAQKNRYYIAISKIEGIEELPQEKLDPRYARPEKPKVQP